MEKNVPVNRARESARGAFSGVEEVLLRSVRNRVFPGAAAALGTSSGPLWLCGVGRQFYQENSRPIRSSTIYDLASLTKVIATTSTVMRLHGRKRISLETPVQDLVEDFKGEGKEKVLVEHLLAHSSGLPSWKAFFREADTREAVMRRIKATPLLSPPDRAMRYSDLGAILLGECAARAGGLPLATLSWKLVFEPLAMRDTCFRPPATDLWRIAPTEEDRTYRGRLIHGEVHDENAWALGGVAGHAGLFSTAEDLSRFALELLRAVRGEGRPGLFESDTARLFTTRRGKVPGSSRALGWGTRAEGEDGTGPRGTRSSSGSKFSPGSFGHTGFTGTSIWLDPARNRFAILLTNRVHPTREGKGMLEARRAFHDAVAESLDRIGASR